MKITNLVKKLKFEKKTIILKFVKTPQMRS